MARYTFPPAGKGDMDITDGSPDVPEHPYMRDMIYQTASWPPKKKATLKYNPMNLLIKNRI